MYASQNRKMYEVYNNKSIVNDSKEGQRFHQKQSELVDQDVYEINPCRNAAVDPNVPWKMVKKGDKINGKEVQPNRHGFSHALKHNKNVK